VTTIRNDRHFTLAARWFFFVGPMNPEEFILISIKLRDRLNR